MTDRINAIAVVLEQDTRTDDAEAILSAIRQIRGVLSVESRPVDNFADHIAYMRAKDDLWSKVSAVFWPDTGGKL